MCRYASGVYSCRWACFDCCKAFKSAARGSMWSRCAYKGDEMMCPQCEMSMVDEGQDFKPPRKQATNQWRKVQLLALNGITFHSCGCVGPGPRPRTLSEAKRWIKQS